jgi:Dyp-type peroxidase family
MANLHQAAIAYEGALAGVSLEWRARDARALWALLPDLAGEGYAIGIGATLAAAVGASVPGLRAFPEKRGGRHTMPSTQADLWILVPGGDPSSVFEIAERLKAKLSPVARLDEATNLFAYRQGRDLTGYRDGVANPKEAAALAAAVIAGGPMAGGSFALVQRWLHFRDRFAALPQDRKDHVIGRRLADDEELDTAPDSAHVKRTDQEGFARPAAILRRSMPWGEARRHGLQFLAFMDDLEKSDLMLARMIGGEDGVQDAILGHSQAETGAYYYVPPQRDGRLVLPETDLAKEAPMPGPVEIVESDTVRLIVEGGLCIHSRNCVLSRPDVFVPNVEGAWLHPELATAEEIVQVAENCPSGAIRYERKDGGAAEKPPMRNVVRVRENGPLAIHGDFTLAGAPVIRATLCRCGKSNKKPYCDGSHKAGFVATGEPATVAEPPPGAMPRKVAIQPVADGPLAFHGAVELVSGTGRTISQADGPTLCRCGQSANKPFCDGSHARAGFRAPE